MLLKYATAAPKHMKDIILTTSGFAIFVIISVAMVTR